MKVCILNERDAQMLVHAGIAYKCSSRRHRHYSKTVVDGMVRAGEMVWLGKHCKVATLRNPRSWKKTYSKNLYGETLSCGMQLVR